MAEMPFVSDWRNNSCDRCPELVASRTATSKVVVASPCPKGGLLAIGEAPGEDEDQEGIGFVGDAGIKLRSLLTDHGLNGREYGVANICRCQPPNNRQPRSREIKSCIPYLASLIQELRPKVILAVGGVTSAAILCGRGTLHLKLEDRCESGDWSANTYINRAHEGIRSALEVVPFVVPMPHTSLRALNNSAPPGKKWPSGEKWSSVAERQVALAVKLLRNG